MEYNLTNQNLGMNQGMNQNQPVDNDLTNLSESSSDFGGMQQNPNQQQAPQQNNFDNELKDNQSVSSYAGSDLSPEETLKKKR